MSTTTRNDQRRQGNRAVSIFLMTIGVVALGASMVMNWRFGWGLSHDTIDRTTIAVLHVLVDPAAAGLVTAGGLMISWGWRREGIIVLLCAGLLIAYSMVSVFGFMSARIALTDGHAYVVAMQKGQLDWTRKTSINRELPPSERRLLRADAKELTKRLERTVAIIPDAQASAIASALSVPTSAVQRALVMIASGIAQSIKFICLLVGVLTWPHRYRDASDATSTPKDDASGGGRGRLKVVSDANDAARKTPVKSAVQAEYSPGLVNIQPMQRSAPGVPRAGAELTVGLHEYLHEYASGHGPRRPQTAIARDFGVSQPTVSRQLRRAQERAEQKAARKVMQQHRLNGTAGYGGGIHAPAWA